MNCSRFIHRLAILVFPLACFAGQTAISPTTTLSLQTSNNTSASYNFASQSNGNLGAANISKVNVHSLLYAGASTKIYAHLVPWFGQPNHMNVGYSSTDPAQVKRQITDMISRGIDGIIIDWYGPNNSIDQATQLVMREAESRLGFTFALIVDKGAIQSDSCSTCSAQEILVRQLQYLERTYFSSPAYLMIAGHPVVSNFDIDLFYSIDWNGAQAALATRPTFIFQNNGGFSHVVSGGSYAWVMPATSDYGATYLESFYDTGLLFPDEVTAGAAYKGFDDSLAAWGSKRTMAQQCGQTWLQTFSTINRAHGSVHQLPILQLATWNDYEEGTEIESGIDNCVAVVATLSGNSLEWNVSGNENTVDHYNFYASTDDENLTAIAAPPSGSHSLDLCFNSLPSGSYTLYVQAIGKPGLKNQMSNPVAYSSSCGPGAANVTALPSTLTIPYGQSGSIQVAVTLQSGSFVNPVSFSCSNLPEGMSCSFSPVSVIAGSASASTVLTISTVPLTVSILHQPEGKHWALSCAGWLAFGLGGLLICSGMDRSRKGRARWTSCMVVVTLALSSCGGNSVPQQTRPTIGVSPGTYQITINAQSGTLHSAGSATITVP